MYIFGTEKAKHTTDIILILEISKYELSNVFLEKMKL